MNNTCTVLVDGRKFIVTFNISGVPTIIKERVLYAPGRPWECYTDLPRWHHAHNATPKNANSLYARVLAKSQILHKGPQEWLVPEGRPRRPA